MNNGITIPIPILERLHNAVARLVAKIDPRDTEAQQARSEAVAVLQEVTNMTDDEAIRDAMKTPRAEKNGAQVLLELAEKAEKEGWKSGVTDLAENHDKYFLEAWKKQEEEKKQREP